MITLNYPFTVASPSLPMLALKIVQGKYPPMPSWVDKTICKLVDEMLKIDSTERPSVKVLMGYGDFKELMVNNLNEEEMERKKIAQSAHLEKIRKSKAEPKKSQSITQPISGHKKGTNDKASSLNQKGPDPSRVKGKSNTFGSNGNAKLEET